MYAVGCRRSGKCLYKMRSFRKNTGRIFVGAQARYNEINKDSAVSKYARLSWIFRFWVVYKKGNYAKHFLIINRLNWALSFC